jgi:hypothetical protein
MRILVATSSTIPGYSGGWTTTLDLLGEDHEPAYLIVGARPGMHSMEGVRFLGLGIVENRSSNPGRRLAGFARRMLTPPAMKWAFRHFRADLVLCLDEVTGFAALRAGLPYAMRFHNQVSEVVLGAPLDKLLKGALFATACQGSEVPGVEVLPHNQDLSRFEFAPAARPERALLLTCMNEEHEPHVFIEGVVRSRGMTGDIIGTGPLRKSVERMCRATGGRVRCLDPVPRLDLGRLSGLYQAGVATLVDRPGINKYQMKINMYLACGMHALVKPFSHIVREAPEFVHTFSDPGELALRLDWVQSEWTGLEEKRIRARDWVMRNCSVDIPRRRFKELLAEATGRTTLR